MNIRQNDFHERFTRICMLSIYGSTIVPSCHCVCPAEMDPLMTSRVDNHSDTAGMDGDPITPPPGAPPLLTPAGTLSNWPTGHRFNTGTSKGQKPG